MGSHSLGIILLEFYKLAPQATAFVSLSIELLLQAADLIHRLITSIWYLYCWFLDCRRFLTTVESGLFYCSLGLPHKFPFFLLCQEILVGIIDCWGGRFLARCLSYHWRSCGSLSRGWRFSWQSGGFLFFGWAGCFGCWQESENKIISCILFLLTRNRTRLL